MPVGQSGLNTNNKFVFIMEEVYVSTRQKLVDMMRFTVFRMFTIGILGILSIVIGIVLSFADIKTLYALPIVTICGAADMLYIYKITKKTYRETEVKAPNRILFGKEYNIYEVNEKDVFDTIMLLHEGNGLIKARQELINFAFVTNMVLYGIYIIISVIMACV